VDGVVVGELASDLEAVVEVAAHLDEPTAVDDRLAELAHRDLALGTSTAAVMPACAA
jgi:hypothetical protein